LFLRQVYKISVSNAVGCGQQKGYTETYRGTISEVNLRPKLRLEIAVNDNFVKPAIEGIIAGARTGKNWRRENFCDGIWKIASVSAPAKWEGRPSADRAENIFTGARRRRFSRPWKRGP